MDLLLQSADCRAEGSELAFYAVTPEAEHPELSFLMAPHGLASLVTVAAAGEGREHRCVEGDAFLATSE